jgi:hypothetical protein
MFSDACRLEPTSFTGRLVCGLDFATFVCVDVMAKYLNLKMSA